MKIYTTTDIAASVRRAHQDFTHVVLNRGYTLLKPVYFKSGLITDLPIHLYAEWEPASHGQLTAWRENGGILIDRGTDCRGVGPKDVAIMVECPLNKRRLDRVMFETAEYGVIPLPHTWDTHEWCINIRYPTKIMLERLWRECQGLALTDGELSAATELPVSEVQYMRNVFHPREEWEIKKRLAPTSGLLEVYDKLVSGKIMAKKIDASTKKFIRALANQGHISLTRRHIYPKVRPSYRQLASKREKALNDLAEIRKLVEALRPHQIA